MISAALAMLETDEQRQILSEFYEENKNRFYSIAVSKLKNPELAEEAVQETFLRIVKYPDRFYQIEPHKKLPYAIIIIRNVILQMLSKDNMESFDELTEDIPDQAMSVEDKVIGRISGDELMNFIRSLPEAKKQALILKGVYGLSTREMAGVLGITESAVRRRIADAYGKVIRFVREG